MDQFYSDNVKWRKIDTRPPTERLSQHLVFAPLIHAASFISLELIPCSGIGTSRCGSSELLSLIVAIKGGASWLGLEAPSKAT